MEGTRSARQPLSANELSVIFEAVMQGEDLSGAAARLPHRHRQTVGTVYGIAKTLQDQGLSGLPTDQVAVGIVRVVGYKTTPRQVQAVAAHWSAWVQSRGDAALLQHAKVQAALDHRQQIRGQLPELRNYLRLPSTWTVNNFDLGAGQLSSLSEWPPLYWTFDSYGRCLRALPQPLVNTAAHLRSAEISLVSDALAEWEEAGGLWIRACHSLYQEIRSASELATGLRTIFTGAMEPINLGLSDGFSRTIYRAVVDSSYEPGYMTVSDPDDLQLLATTDPERRGASEANLAWVKKADYEKTIENHMVLCAWFRQQPAASEINTLTERINKLVELLQSATVQMECETLIPGRCSDCPL